MKRPILWSCSLLLIGLSILIWQWPSNRSAGDSSGDAVAVAAPPPVTPSVTPTPHSARQPGPVAQAAAAFSAQLNGGQISATQRDAAQRRRFATAVFAKLNPLLAQSSAGRQPEFEQILQDFLQEHAADFQDLASLQVGYECQIVPTRINPATRQFPGPANPDSRAPQTMLTLIPSFP